MADSRESLGKLRADFSASEATSTERWKAQRDANKRVDTDIKALDVAVKANEKAVSQITTRLSVSLAIVVVLATFAAKGLDLLFKYLALPTQ